MENDPARIKHATFRVPYINGRYVVLPLLLMYLGAAWLGWLPVDHFIFGVAPSVDRPHDWLAWLAELFSVSSDSMHLWFSRIPISSSCLSLP